MSFKLKSLCVLVIFLDLYNSQRREKKTLHCFFYNVVGSKLWNWVPVWNWTEKKNKSPGNYRLNGSNNSSNSNITDARLCGTRERKT